MQVTPIIVANSLLQNIENQESRISTLQQEEATGQLFSVPADNPMAAQTTLSLNNALNQVNTFVSSAQSAQGWLNEDNGALTSLIHITNQALQTATEAANSTNNTGDLVALSQTVNEMQANVGQILNTQYQGVYIFGGFNNQTPVVSTNSQGQYPTSITLTTTANQVQRFEINNGVNVTVTLTGLESVGQTANTNYFQNLYNDLGALSKAIQQGPQATQNMLSTLQGDLQSLSSAQALVGGRLDRVNNMVTQLNQAQSDLTQNVANVSGANMAQVTTQLAQEQDSYQAALQSGSQILSLSLLNFINP